MTVKVYTCCLAGSRATLRLERWGGGCVCARLAAGRRLSCALSPTGFWSRHCVLKPVQALNMRAVYMTLIIAVAN